MKNFILILSLFALSSAFSQDNESRKVGWFISPEVGSFIHADHFSKTVGGALGVKLFKNHLKIGWQLFGAPGPINPYEYTITPAGGQLYKGKNSLQLRSDHGAMGLYLAPVFNIKKIRVELPIGLGMMGSGFYLQGEDRLTPDGARVSVWEDILMDGKDAGFSNWLELGVRALIPLKNEHISLGAGLHYSFAPDWEAYAEPTGTLYDNVFRFSLVLSFESK